MTDHKTLNDSDISNPEYRTFVYNKIDGKVVSQIVDAPKAVELFEQGWLLSPAPFHDNEEYTQDPIFVSAVDQHSTLMNQLLNIENISNKAILLELSNDFLKLGINEKAPTHIIKNKLIKELKKQNLIPQDIQE